MPSEEYTRLKTKFPNHVFVIVRPHDRADRDLPPLDKHKYVLGKDTTVGMFLYILRQRMTLDASKALFLFCENTLPTTSQTFGNLWRQYSREDGFLYLVYAGESTFGC